MPPQAPHGQSAPAPAKAGSLSPAERRFLLELARRAVLAAARDHHGPPPEVDAHDLSDALREAKACFVTLTGDARLRGCIGHLEPKAPLWRAVIENARGAAIRDPRFDPVEPDEVPSLHIEISVLTLPQTLASTSPADLLARLRPGIDGVILNISGRRATFLPQVWEQLPDPASFLDQLARKADCATEAWREPDALVSTYQVECFEEP